VISSGDQDEGVVVVVSWKRESKTADKDELVDFHDERGGILAKGDRNASLRSFVLREPSMRPTKILAGDNLRRFVQREPRRRPVQMLAGGSL
jgi:hypothetical protein